MMSKITNKKEKYCTRSRISNKIFHSSKETKISSETRDDFSLDANGYFIWNHNQQQKKI